MFGSARVLIRATHGLPRHPAEFARGKGVAGLGSAVAARRTGQTFESRGGGTTPFRQRPRKRGLSNSPFPSRPTLISQERDDDDRRDDQHLGQRQAVHQPAHGAEDDGVHHSVEQPVHAAAGMVRVVASVGEGAGHRRGEERRAASAAPAMKRIYLKAPQQTKSCVAISVVVPPHPLPNTVHRACW